MQDFKSFLQDLTKISSQDFEAKALELFRFQANTNKVYKSYLQARNFDLGRVSRVEDIPFLPIQFFKDFKVVSGDEDKFTSFYSSSGTTGMITSKHFIASESSYLEHTVDLFEEEYGSLDSFHVLALLPAYLERKGSSLVSMANHWIERSGSPHSGFYLYDHKELLRKIESLASDQRKILLLGVTFALLDICESGLTLKPPSNLLVMETGGMKGRRKEMIREEVHDRLKPFFQVDKIHSEYGMTEMMSQAYSKGDGKYKIPSCMRVVLRDLNDPLSLANGDRGGINIIDLANVHSCAFLETQDLGRLDEYGMIEVLGRIDNSEIRGCNLLV